MKKLLVLILVLIPVLAFAGVDDTNFKCYTITPDKMLGTGVNTNLEDTPYSNEMTNIYNNGDSLTNFSNGSSINSAIANNNGFNMNYSFVLGQITYNLAADKFLKLSDSYYFYKIGSKPYFKNDSYASEMTTFPYTGYNSNLFIFNGLYNGANKTYIACDSGLGVYSYSAINEYIKTFEVDLTPSWWSNYGPTSFTMWKKRLFVSGFFYNFESGNPCSNYIYYSKSGDFSNFTPTQYQGGIITIQPRCQIYNLTAVKDGVYIFTSDGIYYLSGGLPETWRLEKISNLTLKTVSYLGTFAPDYIPVCIYNGAVLFIDTNNNVNSINNTAINKIATIQDTETTTNYKSIQVFKEYIVIVTSYKTIIYDIKNKCWHNWDNYIQSINENGYVSDGNFYLNNINEFLISGGKLMKGYISPSGFIDSNTHTLNYETSWNSLDGSSANYKKLKRIEIDVKSGYNPISLKIKTNKNSTWAESTKEVALTNGGYVYADDNSPTYTFRFSGTNEFQKIKLRFETRNSLILSQIRIYYEPVGVK